MIKMILNLIYRDENWSSSKRTIIINVMYVFVIEFIYLNCNSVLSTLIWVKKAVIEIYSSGGNVFCCLRVPINIGKTITIWWNFINETLSEDYSITCKYLWNENKRLMV